MRCIRRKYRPVGCWAPKDTQIAVAQTSGRQQLNIHGAIDLETGKTRMLEVATVNAASMIMLLMAIEAMYPGKRLIHLFVDNARYHHPKLVQAWLARPECRMRLHLIPVYCPHLDPIERLWGLTSQTHHPQPVLRDVRRFQSCLPEHFCTRRCPETGITIVIPYITKQALVVEEPPQAAAAA